MHARKHILNPHYVQFKRTLKFTIKYKIIRDSESYIRARDGKRASGQLAGPGPGLKFQARGPKRAESGRMRAEEV